MKAKKKKWVVRQNRKQLLSVSFFVSLSKFITYLTVRFSQKFPIFIFIFSSVTVCGLCMYIVGVFDLLCHWLWHQLYTIIYHTISTSSLNPFSIFTHAFSLYVFLHSSIQFSTFPRKSSVDFLNEHLQFLIRIVCIVEFAFEQINKQNKHENNRSSSCISLK